MYEQNVGGMRQQQGGNSPGSRGPQSGQRSGRAPIPLRPVTIRMILAADRVGDGAMIISGNEVGTVTIAGRVIEAHSNDGTGAAGTARSHTYKISDGTGVITMRHWIDGSGSSDLVEEGMFVSATGNVKVFQEKPQLTGSLRVLEDTNELILHLLDSVNVHLRMTQGDRRPAGAKAKGSQGASTPSAVFNGGAVAGNGSSVSGGLEAHVQDALRGNTYNIAQLQAALQQRGVQCNAGDVKAILDQRVTEGTVFQLHGDSYSC